MNLETKCHKCGKKVTMESLMTENWITIWGKNIKDYCPTCAERKCRDYVDESLDDFKVGLDD
jgi:hypothetical protein